MPQRRSLSDRVTDSFRILTELDLSHAYERQAGTIALGVLAVLALVGVLATGGLVRRGGGTIPVSVELPAAAGLARGDPVLMRGVRVGRVEGIQLLSPGRVRVTLSVEEAHAPRTDADAQLVALDLVGNQAVLYEPGGAGPLARDASVIGSSSVVLNDRLAQLKEQAAELIVGLREVDPEALSAEVRRTREALARARAVARAFPTDSLALAARAVAARGDSLVASFEALRAAFPGDALQAQRESLATNAAALLADVGEVQETLGRLREQVAHGEGSAGRLMRDTTFRHELDAARTSLRLLLEKFGGRRPATSSPPR